VLPNSGSFASGELPRSVLPSAPCSRFRWLSVGASNRRRSGSEPRLSRRPVSSLPSSLRGEPSAASPSGELPRRVLPNPGSFPSGELPRSVLPSGSFPSGELPRSVPPRGSFASGELPRSVPPRGSFPSGELPRSVLPRGSFANGELPRTVLTSFPALRVLPSSFANVPSSLNGELPRSPAGDASRKLRRSLDAARSVSESGIKAGERADSLRR